jgi:protein-disulfide isomerase
MKKQYFILFILIPFLFFVSSCREKLKSQKSTVVASIEGLDSINLSEIDNLSKQELYDELNRIYIIRKTTLNLLLKDKVLQLEAKKNNKSTELFLQNYFNKKINDSVLKEFIKHNNLTYGIPDLKRNLRYFDIKSVEGHELLIEAVKKSLKQDLIDSLFKVFKVKILLNPPSPIEIDMNKKNVYYRGNLSSKVSIIEVSDFECEACRKTFPIMKEIYIRYKDKVKFGFSNFSSYTTICAIASECAAKQNKFWEMHDLIINMKELPDSIDLINLANKINLNVLKFKKDLNDNSIKADLNKNFEWLKSIGLYGTPSLIINNKVVFNSSSKEEIEKILNGELKKYSSIKP